MGVNTALIYYYFDNKEDLFRATIQSAISKTFESVHDLEKSVSDPAMIIDAWLTNQIELYDGIHKLIKNKPALQKIPG